MQQGIPIEKAREIVKTVKNSKKKVQASIQGDLVRITGKDRDTLQEIIALLRQQDFGIDMQFTNYRTN
jgi:cyclic-di-GMP-binding protein